MYIPLVALTEASLSQKKSERALECERLFCQSGANLAPIKRKRGWDILAYIPFNPMIKRPQMDNTLAEICCQSGAVVALTRKSHRWIVLDVHSIGGVD